ncbi:uncharacterized protein BDZ99DRAFT_466034 [Mytilinidion resinicola]|uniref:Uncharacterized protein n=1 Tax=Mytilinidion resinicola TaxID=574789 RepID=A0A6A6YEN3_9PEZI|nr:uncharacterized protein BDZ99DRAFT_466034 [Mytilinidion resinicola]KAF2806464.1 hypothetical protein BDZ99DRAFT_466034 [Mytilinidion resinicola]
MTSKPSATRLPSTSSPTTPQTQRPRPKKLLNPDHEAEGGVMLPPTSTPSSSKLPTTKPIDPKSTDATGPNRRRKPRKLNKDPLPTDTTTAAPKAEEAAVGNELEALKSRVRGLEAKVEELYTTGKTGNPKSPRRRGKGRKGSTPALPSTGIDKEADAEADAGIDAPETAELERLESELALARLDLATLSTTSRAPRPRPSASRVQSQDEDVEDIPRGSIPSASDPRPRTTRNASSANDRSVTLTGSYRIPLPPSVSIDDVRTIQSGIGAAQNVARSFLDSRRENAAKTGPTQSTARTAPPGRKSGPDAGGGGEAGEGGQSWGEWFGAYSMSISRAVKKIEAEAGVEVGAAQPRIGAARPSAGARRASAPGVGMAAAKKGSTAGGSGAGAKATGGGNAAKGAASNNRPPLKPRASNSNSRMSAEQVKMLMS